MAVKVVDGKLVRVPNGGGAAFPCPEGVLTLGAPGMTLRQWYAGQAVAGVIASFGGLNVPLPEPAQLAAQAFQIADAMIDEGERLHEAAE